MKASYKLGAIALFALVAAPAMAQVYLRGEVGYAWAQDADFKNDTSGVNAPQIGSSPSMKKVEDSANYGIALGYRFSPSLRSDISYGVRDGFRLKDSDKTPATPTNTYTSDIKSSVWMLNVYYDFDQVYGFRPYVGAGLGWSRNEMGTLSFSFPSVPGAGSAPGGTKTDTAWQISFGGSWALNKNASLDIGYRYIDLGKVATKAGNSVGSASLGLPLVTDGISGKLAAQEVNVGLRYDF